MKKAFTLLEMLAVISVLSILVIISSKSITNLVFNGKKTTYESQINTMLTAFELYAKDNSDSLPSLNESAYITLYQLKQSGYLNDVYNPKTDNSFPDDMIFKITNNGSYLYSIVDYGKQINNYNTLPNISFNKFSIEKYNLNDIYIEDIPVIKSYDGNNLSYSSKTITYIDSEGNEENVNNIDTSKIGLYKIVYIVNDNENTVSYIKNVIISNNSLILSATVSATVSNNVMIISTNALSNDSNLNYEYYYKSSLDSVYNKIDNCNIQVCSLNVNSNDRYNIKVKVIDSSGNVKTLYTNINT